MRAHNFKDLLGQTFGRWSVVGPYEIKTRKNGKRCAFWFCRCVCGLEKFVNSGQLVYGSTTACKRCGGGHLKAPGVSARTAVLVGYRRAAAERGFDWDLTDLQFDCLTLGNCFYCGIEPYRARTTSSKNGSFIYNGIDRIDNTKGYISDNVVSCCKVCNRAKDVMSREDFLAWVKRVMEYERQRVS